MFHPLKKTLVDRFYIWAGSENTSPNVLTRLARNHSKKTRKRVAENPHTPTEVLHLLSRDADIDVRIALSDNINAPAGLLLLLAADSSLDVRYAVAENHSMPKQVLVLLARDENPYVANRALRTLVNIRVSSPNWWPERFAS